jgi:hypothetical protein
MTPLIVLLIDLLAHTSWRLPKQRVVDTLLGCAIVLLFGYATWPSSRGEAGQYGQYPAVIVGAVQKAKLARDDVGGTMNEADRIGAASRQDRQRGRLLHDVRLCACWTAGPCKLIAA